jgi:hypothetical protein
MDDVTRFSPWRYVENSGLLVIRPLLLRGRDGAQSFLPPHADRNHAVVIGHFGRGVYSRLGRNETSHASENATSGAP